MAAIVPGSRALTIEGGVRAATPDLARPSRLVVPSVDHAWRIG